MKKWGLVISGFYAFVVLVVLAPMVYLLSGEAEIESITSMYFSDFEYILYWPMLVWAFVLLVGQALLLFLSVDTSFRRQKARQHVALTIAQCALMFAILSGMAIWSILAAVYGDKSLPGESAFWPVGIWLLIAAFWIAWAVLFYYYRQSRPGSVECITGWLLKGSVLELLVAVPCHIIVRQRGDCSAPFVTGYGIATGIAIMLMSFGPGVLFLYQKRLAAYDAGKKRSPDSG